MNTNCVFGKNSNEVLYIYFPRYSIYIYFSEKNTAKNASNTDSVKVNMKSWYVNLALNWNQLSLDSLAFAMYDGLNVAKQSSFCNREHCFVLQISIVLKINYVKNVVEVLIYLSLISAVLWEVMSWFLLLPIFSLEHLLSVCHSVRWRSISFLIKINEKTCTHSLHCKYNLHVHIRL